MTTTAPSETGLPAASSLAHRVSRSLFWNAVLVPVAFVLSAVMSILIRRTFGLRSGIYDVVSGLVGSVLLYSSLGLSTALTKFLPELEVARGRHAVVEFLGRAVGARLAVLVAIMVPMNAFAPAVAAHLHLGEQGALLVRLATAMVAARAALDLGVKTLNAFLAQREVNVLAIVQAFTDPAFIAIAIAAGWGIPGVIGALAASSAFMALGAVWSAARILRTLPKEGRRATGATSAPAPVIRAGTSDLARFAGFSYVYELSLYFAGPAFACPALAMVLGDPSQVALFSTGFYVAFNLVGLVVAGFRGVYRPMFAHLRASGDPERLRAAFVAVTKAQIVMLLPVGVGLYVMCADFLPLLYGKQFVAGVWATRTLVALLFTETAFNLGLIVLSIDERYAPVLGAQALLVICAPLFLLAAKWSGVTAAAAVLGCARVTACMVGYAFCRRWYGLRFPWAFTARVSLVSGVMGVALVAVRSIWPTSILEATTLTAAGAIVFAIGLRLARVIGPEERALLERARIPGGRWLVRWLVPASV